MKVRAALIALALVCLGLIVGIVVSEQVHFGSNIRDSVTILNIAQKDTSASGDLEVFIGAPNDNGKNK